MQLLSLSQQWGLPFQNPVLIFSLTLFIILFAPIILNRFKIPHFIGFTSYHNNMFKIPDYLNKYFTENNYFLVYPIQSGVGDDVSLTLSNPSVMEPFREIEELRKIITKLFKNK